MNILLIFTLIFSALFVFFSILIIAELMKRNVKINFLFLRFLLPKYVGDYKKITQRESGSAGILFYCWVVSVNLALLFLILFLTL
jgi:hypothetical protein